MGERERGFSKHCTIEISMKDEGDGMSEGDGHSSCRAVVANPLG